MQESSFTHVPLTSFWNEEYDFPNLNDGGLLGSSDLPASMLTTSNGGTSNHTSRQHPPHRRRKKHHKPSKTLDTQDIYRLGPSLENQWWKVTKDRKKKKKRKHNNNHNPMKRRKDQPAAWIKSSPSLPQLRSNQTTATTEVASTILTKHNYLQGTPPNHIYHDEQLASKTLLLPPAIDNPINPIHHHQKDQNHPHHPHHDNNDSYSNNRTDHNHSTNTQLRRASGHQPSSVLDVPYGQEVLDLDPPIMARTVDPYVVRYFSLLDIDGVGTLRKRHLIHGVRHSWKIREFLREKASPPMRSLCRRPGFASGIAALQTSDPTIVTYPEFRDYCLGLTERREAELAHQLKLDKLQRKRIRKKRKIKREEEIRGAMEDLKAKSAIAEAHRQIEIQMERTQAECDKEKEMLGEFRTDAEKGIKGSKK